MSFNATSGETTKIVPPGKRFPITLENGTPVALLVVHKDDPNKIRVHILKAGEIAIRVDGESKLSIGNRTIEKESFEIHSQNSDFLITVKYTSDDNFNLDDFSLTE